MRSEPFGPLHRKVMDAMTTNETSFFRDIYPFEAFQKQVMPQLLSARASERRLNFWCGAASSGQESYTIAMILREHFPQILNWNFRFTATDISSQMVQRCREGKYGQVEVNRGLPASLMVKHFRKSGLEWQISEELRKMVTFQEMNLVGQWSVTGPFDIVFLRNVLIYFDVETKRSILRKVRSVLRPDGFLFLGGAETTMNLDDSFERVPIDRAGIYRLRAGR